MLRESLQCFDYGAGLLFGAFQLQRSLQIQPELRTVPKKCPIPRAVFPRDGAIVFQDLLTPIRWDFYPACELRRTHFELVELQQGASQGG